VTFITDGHLETALGHAQVTTTRIYTDPTDPLTREAADRIGGLLWPDESYERWLSYAIRQLHSCRNLCPGEFRWRCPISWLLEDDLAAGEAGLNEGDRAASKFVDLEKNYAAGKYGHIEPDYTSREPGQGEVN
jgi:hypothetical protein